MGFVPPALARTAQEAIDAYGTAVPQASTWYSLADLARSRSDLDGAYVQFDRSLPLHQASSEPYSIGWALVRR